MNRRMACVAVAMGWMAGAMGLPIVVFMAWAIVKDDPYGGEPIVIVTANQRAGAATPADSAAQPGGTSVQADKTRPNRYDGPTAGEQPATAEPPPGSKTVNIIDGSSGKRQQVVVAGGPDDGADAAQTLLRSRDR